ncbi:MAG: hypothetical protein QXE32_02740 [Sulfolobales archaeon]
MKKIRIISIGFGNSISNLARFLDLLSRDAGAEEWVWHRIVGGFKAGDLELVGSIDIDCRKINNIEFKIPVFKGFLIDESKILREALPSLCLGSEDDVRNKIKELKPDIGLIAVNSGQPNTVRRYAEIMLELGIPVINMTPERIARDEYLRREFLGRGLIVVGDDLMSQAGGTILHKYLVRFFTERGLRVLRSYQLDVAGTLETLVTTDESVRIEKRNIKSEVIRIEGGERVSAGTTDYVPFLEDQRISHIYLEAIAPMNKIFRLEAKYWSYDGVNALNTLLDVVRAVMYSVREHGSSREVLEEDALIISAYGFKAPPKLVVFEEALNLFEKRFINAES